MATLTAPGPEVFSPAEDAEDIKKACLGWGTDEKAIISILGHRNSFQRKLIRLAYQEIYHDDLVKQLSFELSGHLEKAICTWTLEPAERDAVLAHTALRNGVPDYRVIIEISCVGSPEDLLAVKRAYRFRFKRSLEEDVASHTTGDLRKLLVALASAYRYDGQEIDEKEARSDAELLHDDINGKAYNHEELIRVLSTRSKPHLTATFNRFREIYGKSMTKGLVGDPADEYSAALLTAIRCIMNPKKYFAKVLKHAFNGNAPDEESLSRVIVTRAEKDLKEIKELYLKRNNKSLDVTVSEATSGDYKTFLLALLGNPENY